MARKQQVGVFIIIVLVGFFFRIHLSAQDIRFHPDEALFSTFARNAAVKGDWMLDGELDKTPLSIYLSALSMMFTGVRQDEAGVLHLDLQRGEFSARLPNVFVDTLLIAVLFALTKRLSPQTNAPLLSTWLWATSPYAIAFGGTAFTDSLMVFCGVMALLLVMNKCYSAAGLWLTLSIASKQQGIFFLPLGVLLMQNAPKRAWLHFFVTLVVGLGSILLWDSLRPETSLFTLAAEHNTPSQLFTPVETWSQRLLQWIQYGQYIAPLWPLSIMLVIAGVYAAWYMKNLRWWLGYVGGYLALHTIIAFNLYDRYLLIIAPLLIVVGAVGISHALSQRLHHRIIRFGVVVGLLLSLWGAWDAANGHMPIGGDKGKWDGIIEVANYLNQLPVATVIYDRWMGWELDYYLGVWSNKRRVYYPTPKALASGAAALPEKGARYFPMPIEANETPWLNALRDIGFDISLAYENARFKVFRLIPPLRAGA